MMALRAASYHPSGYARRILGSGLTAMPEVSVADSVPTYDPYATLKTRFRESEYTPDRLLEITICGPGFRSAIQICRQFVNVGLFFRCQICCEYLSMTVGALA